MGPVAVLCNAHVFLHLIRYSSIDLVPVSRSQVTSPAVASILVKPYSARICTIIRSRLCHNAMHALQNNVVKELALQREGVERFEILAASSIGTVEFPSRTILIHATFPARCSERKSL